MIIDGRAIAEDIYTELGTFFAGRGARLGLLVVGVDAVIGSFVRIKTRGAQRLGIETVRIDLPPDATTDDVINRTRKLASETDAIIVQLPLPKQIDVNAVLASIPAQRDVDALHPELVEWVNPTVSEGKRIVDAPVALAVMEILKRANVEVSGKRAVVVGAGRLVGVPTAELLKKNGADVSMFTLQEGSIEDLKTADVIVSGAGKPGLIKPEHIKKGVALIDAGASEQGGVIMGDADPSCAEIASVFTPVPGGVGPVAVAMIFRNLRTLIELEDVH